jgi:hypothetical protein
VTAETQIYTSRVRGVVPVVVRVTCRKCVHRGFRASNHKKRVQIEDRRQTTNRDLRFRYVSGLASSLRVFVV